MNTRGKFKFYLNRPYSQPCSVSCLILLLSLLVASPSLLATVWRQVPRGMPKIPEAIKAYLVHPAAREPNSEGEFEIEVTFQADFDIEQARVSLFFSDEITIDVPSKMIQKGNRIQLFEGKLEAHEQRVQRFSGHLLSIGSANRKAADSLPPSIVLHISYRYPVEAVRGSSVQWGKSNKYTNKYLLRKLEKYTGETPYQLFRPLPVYRRNAQSPKP